ncbi:MAG: hypothetical protein APF82_00440 [Sphingomonadales bacterium BRH_c42]|nr:MAG: hypothetical protein APF82_00440 [Sphingomonadales bacterium BRH_c42]
MSARILHLSGDFPDPFDDRKTQVIRRLIDLTGDSFHHEVVSINRVSPGLMGWRRMLGAVPIEVSSHPFAYGRALQYAAPARGLFHAAMLRRLGDWLAQWTVERGKPDLIVAHKLTIEGIAVSRASQLLGIPYALTLQGNTDCRILAARPDLKPEFARIWRSASAIFAFAPWTAQAVQGRLGKAGGSIHIVPCPMGEHEAAIAPRPGSRRFLSAFHLHAHRNKNLAAIASAMRILRGEARDVSCTIAGGGSERDLRACKSATRESPDFDFPGHLEGEALTRGMNESIALVLPSHRETFGLVFIEALFAGLPIIYPAGAAVDGYFSGRSFAMRVDARSPRSIAAAMRFAMDNEQRIKAELAEWQHSEDARRFMRPAIAKGFAEGLNAALRARSAQA